MNLQDARCNSKDEHILIKFPKLRLSDGLFSGCGLFSARYELNLTSGFKVLIGFVALLLIGDVFGRAFYSWFAILLPLSRLPANSACT